MVVDYPGTIGKDVPDVLKNGRHLNCLILHHGFLFAWVGD